MPEQETTHTFVVKIHAYGDPELTASRATLVLARELHLKFLDARLYYNGYRVAFDPSHEGGEVELYDDGEKATAVGLPIFDAGLEPLVYRPDSVMVEPASPPEAPGA